MSPEGFEANLPESAKHVIKEIQRQVSGGRNRSLLVASRSWLSCIKRAENYKRKDCVICDLLLFQEALGGLHLFTLCFDGRETQSLSYAQTTAKALKRAFVVDGGCQEKFYITYHLVPCTETSHMQFDRLFPDNRYPNEYRLDFSQEKINKILKSLVIVIAEVPSVLSNKQGIAFFNLLTEQQFQLLYQEIERHEELWVKGAAGTGKTLVAVEFIKELKRRDQSLTDKNILYVCENLGLKEKIR